MRAMRGVSQVTSSGDRRVSTSADSLLPRLVYDRSCFLQVAGRCYLLTVIMSSAVSANVVDVASVCNSKRCSRRSSLSSPAVLASCIMAYTFGLAATNAPSARYWRRGLSACNRFWDALRECLPDVNEHRGCATIFQDSVAMHSQTVCVVSSAHTQAFTNHGELVLTNLDSFLPGLFGLATPARWEKGKPRGEGCACVHGKLWVSPVPLGSPDSGICSSTRSVRA